MERDILVWSWLWLRCKINDNNDENETDISAHRWWRGIFWFSADESAWRGFVLSTPAPAIFFSSNFNISKWQLNIVIFFSSSFDIFNDNWLLQHFSLQTSNDADTENTDDFHRSVIRPWKISQLEKRRGHCSQGRVLSLYRYLIKIISILGFEYSL